MLLVCLAVLCLIGSSPCAAAPPWDTTGSGSTRDKLLLISFDGFRWDYDQDVDTPNLDKMAQDGVKAQYVTPAFLTITSPAHFTLLTGTKICTSISISFKLTYRKCYERVMDTQHNQYKNSVGQFKMLKHFVSP